MRRILIAVGIVIFLLGLLWTLQGMNFVQGTQMSEESFWSNVGIVMLIGGLVISYFGWRREA